MPSHYVYRYGNNRHPKSWFSWRMTNTIPDRDSLLIGRWRINRDELQDNKESRKSQIRYLDDEMRLLFDREDWDALALLSNIRKNWRGDKKFCIISVN